MTGVQSSGWREVGYVAGVHGLRGELVLRPHHPASDALSRAKRVSLRRDSGEQAEFLVEGYRPTGKGLAFRLQGIPDRTAAERWRSATAWVSDGDLEALDEGEFYLEDVRGFEVCDGSGAPLGRIVGFTWTNIDIAIIRTPAGREWMLPFTEDRILGVDKEAQKVTVDAGGFDELAS